MTKQGASRSGSAGGDYVLEGNVRRHRSARRRASPVFRIKTRGNREVAFFFVSDRGLKDVCRNPPCDVFSRATAPPAGGQVLLPA